MIKHAYFLFLVILLGLSACEVFEPEIENQPQIALDDSECSGTRIVPLTVAVVPGTSNREYTVKLITGNYNISPCMCRMVGYEIDVTNATWEQWKLFDAGDDSVPFNPWPGPPTDMLEITDIEEIFAEYWNSQSTVLTGRFSPGPPPKKASAKLLKADGLCIIENYDGSGPVGTVSAEPLIELMPFVGSPSGFETVVHIPVGITLPL